MSTNLGWQFYREYFRDLNAIGKGLAFDRLEINELRQSRLLKKALNSGKTDQFRMPEVKYLSLEDLIEWTRIKTAIVRNEVSVPAAFKLKLEKIEVEKKYYELKRDALLKDTQAGPPAIKLGNAQFYAETTYPGLLIGTGYQHMTGGDAEFKIGFYFDYTSGQPVIPGSSVKGVLRSVFPYHRKNLGESFRKPRLAYIKRLVEDKAGIPATDKQVQQLEQEIFEGLDFGDHKAARFSAYRRDIFHDAVISEYVGRQDLLATDYITPHENPLKDPTPLMLLKVPPGVIFRFQFRLRDSKAIPGLTADKKQKMFEQIILDVGVGAKTNVGYGQFEIYRRKVQYKESLLLPLKSGQEFEGEIVGLEDPSVTVKFHYNDPKTTKAVVSKNFRNLRRKDKSKVASMTELVEGDRVRVMIKGDYSPVTKDKLNCQVRLLDK